MKTIVISLILGYFGTGCGDNDKFTWGNLSAEIAVAYCQRAADCGYIGHDHQYDVCVRHTVSHMCELHGTCRVVLPDAAIAATDQCVADTMARECELIFFGFLPASCGEAYSYKPSVEQR